MHNNNLVRWIRISRQFYCCKHWLTKNNPKRPIWLIFSFTWWWWSWGGGGKLDSGFSKSFARALNLVKHSRLLYSMYVHGCTYMVDVHGCMYMGVWTWVYVHGDMYMGVHTWVYIHGCTYMGVHTWVYVRQVILHLIKHTYVGTLFKQMPYFSQNLLVIVLSPTSSSSVYPYNCVLNKKTA